MGKRVILVDLDFETQDLSRFIQARPYINENLQTLIDQTAPVTSDTVKECLTKVWLDEPNLEVLAPFPETSVFMGPGLRLRRNRDDIAGLGWGHWLATKAS